MGPERKNDQTISATLQVHGTGTKKVGDLNRANCTMFGTQEQKMNANADALENDSQEMTRCNPEGG